MSPNRTFSKKAVVFVCALLLSTTLWVGCQNASVTSNKAIAATVNGKQITQAMFESYFEKMAGAMHMNVENLKAPEQKQLLVMFKKMALQSMILDMLLEQEAQHKNLKVDQKQLDQLMAKKITQMGGEEKAKTVLKENHLTLEDLKVQLNKELLKEALVASLAKDKLTITDKQAKAFYDQNQDKFQHDEQVRARHILLEVNPDKIKQQQAQVSPKPSEQQMEALISQTKQTKRQRAQELLTQVQAEPKQFGMLAAKNSNDLMSAQAQGDLGYFSRKDMVPAFSKAAFDTKPGEIYPKLVESPYGFHIIQVLDRRAPKRYTYPEVEAQIKLELQNQVKMQTLQTWVQTAKQQAKITMAPEYQVDEKQLNPEMKEPAMDPTSNKPQ